MMTDPITVGSTEVATSTTTTTSTVAASSSDVQAFEQAMAAPTDAEIRAQIEAGIRKQVMQEIARDTFKKPGKVFSKD